MSLAIFTGIFQANVFDDMQARGRVIKLLTRFTTDFLALFATAGTSTSLFIENVDLRYPRQVRRQFFATTGASRRLEKTNRCPERGSCLITARVS